MNRKPLIIWPPAGDDAKKLWHAEVAAPAAICANLVARKLLDPALVSIGAPGKVNGKAPKWPSLDAWLSDQHSGMAGLVAGGARSWNQPQLVMAARGLAMGDWGDAERLMRMQAGLLPGEGAARFLDGEEPRSTDYDAFRWVAEVVFASRFAPESLRAPAIETLRRQMGLALLGAVPWTDQVEFRAANGRQWYRGPTLSPVGERSPKTSNPDQLGLFNRAAGRRDTCDREGWACSVADSVWAERWVDAYASLLGDVDHSVALLGTAKVIGAFHFAEYPGGRLVWQPQQLNPNTPSALWSWADHRTRIQIRGFPFDPTRKNRGEGAPRSLGCAIEDGEIVARSTDERFEARMKLPTSSPIWAVTVDEQGARRMT